MLNTTNTNKAKVQPHTVAVNNVLNIIIAIAIICGQWFTAHAQTINAQRGITTQAVARDASGNIIANQNISVRFSLITGSVSGPVYYQETQSLTTNSLGLFNTSIFAGASLNTMGVFDPSKWTTIAAMGAYIKIEMDITGGTNYIDMGTTQLMSVPFALYAETAGKATGSVNYKGTWDAATNTPDLSSASPDKGDYYEVGVAGATPLGIVSDWNVGDWAIYNGTTWQKVDNTDDAVAAQDVAFTPNGDLVSTNVQDAIVEVRNETDTKLNTKQNLIGFTPVPDTRTINGIALTADVTLTKAHIGLSNVPDIDATDPSNTVQDATHRFVTDSEKSTWNAKQNKVIPVSPGNFAGLNASGDLTDSQRSPADYLDKTNTVAYTPTADYNPATKKYVDDTAVAIDAQSGSKVNRAGDTMTGNLILNADPTASLGAVTKQYVDAGDNAMQTQVSSKVNRAGDTMTGNLILNADPTTALGAATKKYVDDAATSLGVSNKADKVVGATIGHFAALDASGNLTDGGAKEATNISFTPNTDITSTNVQDAIDELQIDFADLIDSYIHKTDDGVAIYLPPSSADKRFGIGVTTPDCPLGIKATGTNQSLISFHDASQISKWNMNMNPSGSTPKGFNIDQVTTSGNVSRLFIHETNGNVGMGTITPEEKLHVKGANDGGNVSIMVENLESGSGTGWLMSAIDDNALTARQKTFAIHEKVGNSLLERITVLATNSSGIKNVGVNETLPFATLHVTRPPSDPLEPVSLAENTGILLLGQIDNNNLAMDSRQIQARHGSYISNVLNFTVSSLNLQPYGGGITINNGSTNASDKATITTNGMLGLGTTTPVEKIDIDGAIKIGTTTTNNDGTIRYTGTDFEGRKNGAWVSLTADNGPWTTLSNTIYYATGTTPRVGIGTNTATATLDVDDAETVTGGNTAVNIHNSSTTSSNSSSRVALGINCSGVWSSNPSALNIGLYVQQVTGQTNASSNIAAVLNGNVSIGGLTSSSIIGSNGSRVLAIQNGTAPTSAISGSGLAADGGIQLYSQSDAMGTSTFNVMNGDGTIIKLFRTAALTPANNTPVSPVYDPAVQALIENMRQRINELEAKLQALGLLN